jgi:hypothetical protein
VLQWNPDALAHSALARLHAIKFAIELNQASGKNDMTANLTQPSSTPWGSPYQYIGLGQPVPALEPDGRKKIKIVNDL